MVGNGGREHALAWKLSQSKKVEQVFVAPGGSTTQLFDIIQFCNCAAVLLTASCT